ncbi:uncharacterized protein LOC135210749 [Macrobrachium nipponense]|uniref:uncharacterized protein LOC135210749 n=1 Tax=Macrobrachium nipponense TaxID=159736 RepID=UPI0030C7AD70
MATNLCPVILHCNLESSSFLEYLGSGYKVRVSNSTPPDSVILPSCGIAVLVVHLSKVSFEDDVSNACDVYDKYELRLEEDAAFSNSFAMHPKHTDKVCVTYPQQQQETGGQGAKQMTNPENKKEDFEHLVSRIEGFVQGHRMCVVLLVGSVFTSDDKGGKVMCHLQKSLMPSPPLILPAHGDAQIAMHIQSLSKACQPDTRSLVQSRMEEMITGIINKDYSTILARAMGLNHQQASVLMNSFESVANVAAASAADIHQQTPLDASSAATVAAFLSCDDVSN